MHTHAIRLAMLAGCVLGTMVAGGCALGDRHIALNYQPCCQETVGGSPSVAIVKFEDARQLEEVGEVRLGLRRCS